MILSSSIPIQKMLHFGFQNHRKSDLQRIKIDIDFSIYFFIDFYSTWTRFGRLFGGLWVSLGIKKQATASYPWPLSSPFVSFSLWIHLLTLFWAQYTPIWSFKILPQRSQTIKILPNTSIVVYYALSYAYIILTFHHTSKITV